MTRRLVRQIAASMVLIAPSIALAQNNAGAAGFEAAQGLNESRGLDVRPLLSLQRRDNGANTSALVQDRTIESNLGIQVAPLAGLSVSADVWRLNTESLPLGSGQPRSEAWSAVAPSILQRDTSALPLVIEPVLSGTQTLATNGLDIGASYAWATDKAGQFTLSTKATYVRDFTRFDNLPELRDQGDVVGTPDIQGNVTLTWEFGNHSASAVTNYFDSFKDISELNLEEINQLVDQIVTFDLQYGYRLNAGRDDRAIFSFGVRNIFDRKTTQILDNSQRAVDQNGRVAYGSVKYQF